MEQQFTLTREGIDLLSDQVETILKENKIDSPQVIKTRLAVEDALLTYLQGAEPRQVTLQLTKRFGSFLVILLVSGSPLDPFGASETDELTHALLSGYEKRPAWAFRGKRNRLTFPVEKKKSAVLSGLFPLILALALGILLGFAALEWNRETAQVLCTAYLSPVFSAIMGFLTAVASLMIFCSVASGICGMGDISTFHKVGRGIVWDYFSSLLVFALFYLLGLMTLFPFRTGGESKLQFTEIYAMILDIIPPDLISPFVTKNMLQVVFLAVCVGIAVLVVGQQGDRIVTLLRQGNELSTTIIAFLCKLMPLTVFISMFQTVVSGEISQMKTAYKIPLLYLVICLFTIAGILLRTAYQARIPLKVLLHKIGPVCLVALSTGSSSATLPLAKETCQKKLGVPEEVANIGLPLGQVIYMPTVQGHLMLLSFCLMEIYGLSMDPVLLLQLLLSTILLSISLPPVPGGMLSVYTIIFTMMGIPMEGLSIALVFDSFCDRCSTTVDMGALCLKMARFSHVQGTMDREVALADGEP